MVQLSATSRLDGAELAALFTIKLPHHNPACAVNVRLGSERRIYRGQPHKARNYVLLLRRLIVFRPARLVLLLALSLTLPRVAL